MPLPKEPLGEGASASATWGYQLNSAGLEVTKPLNFIS